MKSLCLYSNFYQLNKSLGINRYSYLKNRIFHFLVSTLQDTLHSELCLSEAINWILIVYHTFYIFISQKSNWISQLWTQTGIGSHVIQVLHLCMTVYDLYMTTRWYDYQVCIEYILKTGHIQIWQTLLYMVNNFSALVWCC